MVLYSLCSVVINLAVSACYIFGGNNCCSNIDVSYLRGAFSTRLITKAASELSILALPSIVSEAISKHQLDMIIN